MRETIALSHRQLKRMRQETLVGVACSSVILPVLAYVYPYKICGTEVYYRADGDNRQPSPWGTHMCSNSSSLPAWSGILTIRHPLKAALSEKRLPRTPIN